VWFASGARDISADRSARDALATVASSVSPFERPIIAVLPLKNLSGEPDSDYFVDGLTDEIIRNLGVIQGLEVRSQTSSFAYRDKPRNVRDVGKELGVNLVVEGSVLRSGNRLRINAQMIQVSDDAPLWSDRFDRDLNDVFAIQDEISRAIVNKLRLTLGRGQRRYDTNLAAYDLFLRARALVNRRDSSVNPQPMDLFAQVIEKDPAFAPAYAGLVNAYAFMSMSPYRQSEPGKSIGGPARGESVYRIAAGDARSTMRVHAARALELDPLLAEAHAAMGWVYSRELEWANAERSFQRALELNSTLTQIYVDYSLSTLRPIGKQREAERLLKLAMTNDPLSLELRRELANVQLDTGQYAEAVANLERALAQDPEFPATNLSRALSLAGRLPEAIALLQKQGPGAQQYLAHAYVRAGRHAEAERLAAANRGFPFREAIIYAALGDKDRSFDALQRMAATEPQRLGLALMFPEIAVLRDDPRYAALRRKLRLPS
jgi:TolB-like protein